MSTSNPDAIYVADEYDFDDEFAFWPLNLVLVILGATILGVAFTYLDPADQRLIHNPWTYVVITPIVLMLISVILSTIVSRIIAKSMQMAFLLSVLVHLFMIIGAMNVVIFSQLWPQILESMANERQQLKRREVLRAPQYHRVASTSQTGSRPDYLKHVPTEHQPTELKLAETKSISLTRSTRNNLVSPKPEIQLSANPHLLKRNRPSPAAPSMRDSAASLSRSDLQRELNIRSQPQQYELPPEMQRAPELKPSASSSRASRSQTETNSAASIAELQAPTLRTPQPSVASAGRRAMQARETSPTQMESMSLSRASRNPKPLREPQINVPNLSQTQSQSQTNMAANSAASSNRRASREQRSDANLTSPNSFSDSVPSPRVARDLVAPRMKRQEAQRRIPDASTGEFASALARSTAGGRAGVAAPSSMPIQGFENIGAQQSGTNKLAPPSLAKNRRATGRRSSGGSEILGQATGPRWTGEPSLSAGVSGMSPSQLANAAGEGTAIGNDSAGLSGQGRVLERSRTGISGLAGTLSGPVAPSGSGQVPSQADNGSQLAANEGRAGRLSRNSSGGAALAQSAATGSSESVGARANALAGNGLTQRAERDARGSADDSIQDIANGAALSRSSTPSSATPLASAIEVPEAGVGESGQQPNLGLASNDLSSGRTNRTRGGRSRTNLLALNQPSGVGGISPVLNVAGDLLPRRNERGRSDLPTDIDVQRFARQNVGGPLAAGQIAIPKPAFQQRLDRLKDRDSLDETAAEPQTELAIEQGLEFLARYQRADGSWRLQDFDSQVLMTSDTAATGLALLAFQGAGYTHKNFKYADVCDRAVQFLKQNQRKNGDLYIPQDPASDQNAWLYSHGIAAIAMCEAYGMTQDPEIRDAAQKAVDFISESQDPRRGGWRYRPGAGSDTSVSGWYMMALQSAKLAGLDIDQQTLQRLRAYLSLSQSQDGQAHLYRYNPYASDTPQQRHGLKPTAVMTSVGLLMRLYTGWKRDRQEMKAGAEYLLRHRPEQGTRENSKRDTYYWYYSTQVMFHMGGEIWEQWHDALYPMLIENQVLDGKYKGSWDPVTPTPDLWARYGGRLYVTTMNLLSLEVTYRHLPIYDATAPLE